VALDLLRFFSRPKLALDAVGGYSAVRLTGQCRRAGQVCEGSAWWSAGVCVACVQGSLASLTTLHTPHTALTPAAAHSSHAHRGAG